jgi:hypothetical protein
VKEQEAGQQRVPPEGGGEHDRTEGGRTWNRGRRYFSEGR